MTPYARLSPGDGSIKVRFDKPNIYTYTVRSAGAAAIAEMTRLAHAGKGLSTYINEHKPRYESKTR